MHFSSIQRALCSLCLVLAGFTITPSPADRVTSYPKVLASPQRDVAIELLEFEGSERIQNRDARGYYFTLRLKPKGTASRVGVIFSGSVLVVKPNAFGLPDFGDRETAFRIFAEAAIGDYLDDNGLPEFAGHGTKPAYIDCFSPHFQLWKDRAPATDVEVETYLRSHCLESWKYDHLSWHFGPADLLRLNIPITSALKIARFQEGVQWTISDVGVAGMILTPKNEFLREQKVVRAVPNVLTARRATDVDPENEMNPASLVFVDESRIAELRAVDSRGFDLRKLLSLCDELNHCYRAQCYHAVAAITRAVIDHVPPIFRQRTFAEVSNNYAGSRSFKECAKHLDEASRKIADAHLHTQVRRSEVLPSRVQVNFSNELDVVIAEVIRILQVEPSSNQPHGGAEFA